MLQKEMDSLQLNWPRMPAIGRNIEQRQWSELWGHVMQKLEGLMTPLPPRKERLIWQRKTEKQTCFRKIRNYWCCISIINLIENRKQMESASENRKSPA